MDENPYLPPQLRRNFGEVTRQLGRNDLRGGHAAAERSFQRATCRGFDSAGQPRYDRQSISPFVL